MIYNGEAANGPQVLFSWLLNGDCQYEPPQLVIDYQPPNSVRPLATCSADQDTAAGSGVGNTCAEAFDLAIEEAEVEASNMCQFGVCQAAPSQDYCGTSGKKKVALASYVFSCFATYNLCEP